MTKKVNIAVIDMNNGTPNQGMRGIIETLDTYQKENKIGIHYRLFDIRKRGEVPDTSFDIYISSGGPGNPFEGETSQWEADFFNLLDDIDAHNKTAAVKKHVFFICHSFQLACRKYKLGKVIQRKSTAFGIFPITLMQAGKQEAVFKGLSSPFFAVDSRDWQVVKSEKKEFEKKGAQILAIEKERPHIDLERCLMAIRFSPYMIGTQFHPEADPIGMKLHLLQDEKKKSILNLHGEAKYADMLKSLENPRKIKLTKSTILPNFLHLAIKNLFAKPHDKKLSRII